MQYDVQKQQVEIFNYLKDKDGSLFISARELSWAIGVFSLTVFRRCKELKEMGIVEGKYGCNGGYRLTEAGRKTVIGKLFIMPDMPETVSGETP